MKTHLWLVILLMFLSSCGVNKTSSNIVDYNHLLFSNGECSTVLGTYILHDTITTDTMEDEHCILFGNVFARDPLQEIYGAEKSERFSLFDNCLEWPHLFIPSLNLDVQMVDGSYRVDIPSGLYDVIIFANDYDPIHIRWNFISHHIYSIDFYLGCSVIH